MNAAALTAFLDVVTKRLTDELHPDLHSDAVRESLIGVQTSIASAMAITTAAIQPQQQAEKKDSSGDQPNLPKEADPEEGAPLPD